MPDSSGRYSDQEIDAGSPEAQRAAIEGQPPSGTASATAGGGTPGQWLSDPNSPLGQYGGLRKAAIAADEFVGGIPVIPAAAARFGYNALAQEFPSMGEPPSWLAPGSYAPFASHLTPMTPGERITAAGARAAGTAFPFEGPYGAAIQGGASTAAQIEREVGLPEWMATSTDVLGGVGGAARHLLSPAAPVVAMPRYAYSKYTGLPMAVPAAAAGRAGGSVERGILGTMMGEPIAAYAGSRWGPAAGLAVNAAFGLGGYLVGGGYRGLPTFTNATAVASRLLGGYTIGDTVANMPSPGVGTPPPNPALYSWPETGDTGDTAGAIAPIAPLAPQ